MVIIGAAAGLAALFANFSGIRIAAQLLGALYILYIAIKIATAPVVNLDSGKLANAPKFRDGFILNLLNVKAYAVFLAIFSQFLLPFDQAGVSYISTGLVCVFVATVVDIIWLWLGSAISHLFSQPSQARILRIVFALLMLVAVTIVLID